MADARMQALDAARDEYRRLLYVAMTRAAERLVVCGTKGVNKVPEGCWHQLVRDALEADCVREKADDGNEVLRYRKGEAEAAPAKGETAAPAEVSLPNIGVSFILGCAGNREIRCECTGYHEVHNHEPKDKYLASTNIHHRAASQDGELNATIC